MRFRHIPQWLVFRERLSKKAGDTSLQGDRLLHLDHADLPDPVTRALTTLLDHVEKLEQRLEEVTSRQGSLENRFDEEDEELQRVRTLLKNGAQNPDPH